MRENTASKKKFTLGYLNFICPGVGLRAKQAVENFLCLVIQGHVFFFLNDCTKVIAIFTLSSNWKNDVLLYLKF